jgi:hypothetical protein
MRAERIERIERAERSERAALPRPIDWLVCLLVLLALAHVTPAEAGTYAATSVPFNWVSGGKAVDVVWTGKTSTPQCTGPTAPADDDITAELPIGFTFPYGNANHTSVRIMTNGRLQFKNTWCDFGAWATTPRTYPLGYPNKSVERTMRIYGADLDHSVGGRVTWEQGGTSPNRYFVATWERVPEYDFKDSAFTMQMVLYENGDFLYQYGPMVNTSGGIAQVGWQVSTGDYDTIPVKDPAALEKTAILFSVPAPTLSLGRFNAFDTTTASGALSGFIRTKVAGDKFNLSIVALNSTLTGYLASSITGITVQLVDATNDSGRYTSGSNCRTSWPVIATISSTFSMAASDGGRKTLGFVYGGVTREARVRISATVGGSTLTGCSTDGFAIRPAALSAPVATDADWMTAGTTRTLNNASDMGGAVHRAGRPFRLSTSALDAAGAVTSGYTNVPVLQFAGCVLPAACISADITSVTASLATSAGVAATNAASFSEVGSFSARAEDLAFAAIDTSDGSTLAERMITSAASTIGRFVPDAFLLEATNTPEFAPGQGTACTGSAASNFTWVGQPFRWAVAPGVRITARNSAGATVQQYTGTLNKLAASAVLLAWSSNAPSAAALAVTGQTLGLTVAGAGVTNAALGSGASFVFARPSTPVSPFNAVAALTVTLADASESGVAGNGTLAAVAPLVINGGGAGIAFTGGNANGANLVGYGRLQITSAYGDSRRDLLMPYETQMWSGSAWYRNHRDSCLSPTSTAVQMTNWGAGFSSCSVSVASVGTTSRGRGLIRISPPATGGQGYVDLVMRASGAGGTTCIAGAPVATTNAGLSWLLGPWSSAPDYTSNPVARAIFERLRVNDVMRRERF